MQIRRLIIRFRAQFLHRGVLKLIFYKPPIIKCLFHRCVMQIPTHIYYYIQTDYKFESRSVIGDCMTVCCRLLS